jgi:hypothetical protein
MKDDNTKSDLTLKIPKPDVEHIKILEVKEITVPHPYCITPKHLQFNEGMYLDIEGAEQRSREMFPNDRRKWAVCDICKHEYSKGLRSDILPLSEHKKNVTLFLEVPKTENLNEVEGLNNYLKTIKPVLEQLHIDGIAFKQVQG